MFVEKLSLFGFKSFNKKVVLDFGSGISGVVGPNGCGKSNIVDAIRWVLGEQSTKQLRGEKMEDVIFNGTRDEKPLSIAEVTLTLQVIEAANPIASAERNRRQRSASNTPSPTPRTHATRGQGSTGAI